MEPQIQSTQDSQAESMINLEALIQNHTRQVNDYKAELQKVRDMFNDSFNNNPAYREVDEKSKEAIKQKSVIRQQIIKVPQVAELNQKIKDIRADLKLSQLTLSDLLCDYKERTSATQLELFGGELFDIVQTAKLVKHIG